MSGSILERVQADTAEALKAGERERVSTLRMIASALQQDHKLGADDAVAVLQRERKRRLEAAEAFADAGRDEQAAAERAEAELIEAYLPMQLSDAELLAIVEEAIAATGATEQKQMGQVIGVVMGKVGGQADGKRVSTLVRERLARRRLTIDNDVAAELAGTGDSVLDRLEERLACDVFLRGNVITLDGDPAAVAEGQVLVEELVELVERGHELEPGTVDAVEGAEEAGLDPAEMLADTIWRHRGTTISPRTVNQKRYVDAVRDRTVTFGIGPAGTGKTFLAVAMAVAALESREVSRLILTRPAVEAGERLGFLPGDLQEKVDPYLRPLFDALYDMLDPDRVTEYFDRGVIEVAPLAFMRGRSLNDSFVILDEAQNTTPEQMKMFLTRLGFGSKMVVTGDVTQIDLPASQRSGLVIVGEILSAVEDIEFVRFGDADVVRHRLVQRIVAAYARYGEGDASRERDPGSAGTDLAGESG